jgi:hypothetical protein
MTRRTSATFPHLLRSQVHDAPNVGHLPHVSRDYAAVASSLPHELERSPRIGINFEVFHHDAGALLCETHGNGPSDALPATSDDCHFVLQAHNPVWNEKRPACLTEPRRGSLFQLQLPINPPCAVRRLLFKLNGRERGTHPFAAVASWGYAPRTGQGRRTGRGSLLSSRPCLGFVKSSDMPFTLRSQAGTLRPA